MSKTLKHLTLSLFLLIAVFAVGTTTVQAAKRKADVMKEEDSKDFWTATDKKLKFKPKNDVNLKGCFVYLPYHYVFELDGQKYSVAGGCWYIDKDGYLATSTSPGLITTTCYIIDKGSGKASVYKKSMTLYVSNKICKDYTLKFDYLDNDKHEEQNWPKGTSIRFTKDGVVYYLVNAPISINGPLSNGFSDKKLYKGSASGGVLYTGCLLKDGVMRKVTKGEVGKGYTGKVNDYYDYSAKKFKGAVSTIYKNGKPFTGWNVKNKTFTRGYYSGGKIDTSVNYWKKHGKKWYYFVKGKIYHNKKDKKGPSKKALKTNGLNYFGHHAAPKNLKYHYYLNKDGSLVGNVFTVDTSWYKKNVRIMVNLLAGVDNVTFMGYYKGSYSVPLKTVVTTCSGSSSMRAKLVRGYHGRGWWGLGRTGRSRKRDFIFKNRFYYRNAVSILYSGALFHSPRYLKHNNDHSLFPPHFNAMGKKNITTKCVRLQLVNTKIVWRLSKQAKKASVKFVSKKVNDKNAWLPFGNTELSDSTGVKYWKKHYDPSGKF